jgi:hypothetical protein
VSVFDINVAGTISHVSRSFAEGITLSKGGCHTLSWDKANNKLIGIKISKPTNVMADTKVGENLVLIVSGSPVDLRHLATLEFESRGEFYSLSALMYHLVLRQSRNMGYPPELPQRRVTRYDVCHIPFHLLRSS